MELVLCNELDFGINMNNVINLFIDFILLVNELFVLVCWCDYLLVKK